MRSITIMFKGEMAQYWVTSCILLLFFYHGMVLEAVHTSYNIIVSNKVNI